MKFVPLLAVLLSLSHGVVEAEETNRIPADAEIGKRNAEKFREELKKLPPEERQKKIEELRQQFATNRVRIQQPRLSPEQREAKMKEWRERRESLTNRTNSAEGPAKPQTSGERLELLRKKKADGTITPQEERFLNRVEERLKAFEDHKRSLTNQPLPEAPKPETK